MRQRMESNSRVQQMSAEQREQAIQMQLKFVPYMAYLGPLIGGPIGMLAIAGVVMLAARIFGSAITLQTDVFHYGLRLANGGGPLCPGHRGPVP